jgi:hypothetical protein
MSCPNCDSDHQIPDHLAGKKVRCPKCKGPMDVPAGFEVVDDLTVEDEIPVVGTLSASDEAALGLAGPSELFRFNNFRITVEPGKLGTTSDFNLVDPRSNELLGAMRRLPRGRMEIRDWEERIAFALIEDHGYEITKANGRFVGYTDANFGSLLSGFAIRTRSGKTWVSVEPDGRERHAVIHLGLGEIGEFQILRRSVRAKASGVGDDDQMRTMIARISRNGQEAPCGHEAVLSASLLLAMAQFTHDEWKSNLF